MKLKNNKKQQQQNKQNNNDLLKVFSSSVRFMAIEMIRWTTVKKANTFLLVFLFKARANRGLNTKTSRSRLLTKPCYIPDPCNLQNEIIYLIIYEKRFLYI